MWLLQRTEQRCLSADMPAEDLSLQFTFRQTYQPLSDLRAEKQTALFATIVSAQRNPNLLLVRFPSPLLSQSPDGEADAADGLPKNVGVN